MATLTPFLFLLVTLAAAQNPSAPAPSSPGPVNLTGILDRRGQFTTFLQLLTNTQIANQIENQINYSYEGMTVLAPTDNAFNNLKSGAFNGLRNQEQVQLVLYHVLPKFYRLSDFLLVSNPVRTEDSGQDGSWGLNFTSWGNQVNVSTGMVGTQINNALRQAFPLAVYQVDVVLLPEDLFGTKPLAGSPATPKTKERSKSTTSKPAPPKIKEGSNTTTSTPPPPKTKEGSSSTTSTPTPPKTKEGSSLSTSTPASSADEPAAEENANDGRRISVGFGLIA